VKLIQLVMISAGLFWAGMAWGQAFEEVLLTRHNLFPGGSDSMLRDVCMICHLEPISGISPQVAEVLPTGLLFQHGDQDPGVQKTQSAPSAGFGTSPAPLWDSQSSVQVFLPRRIVKPDTTTAISTQLPFGPSYSCLTCHDGVLGNDVHRLGPGGSLDLSKKAQLDREIGRSTDHPDSIVYPRKTTGEFQARSPEVRLARYWSIPDRTRHGLVIPDGPMSDYLHLENLDLEDPLQTASLIRTSDGVIHCDSCHNPHLNLHRPFLRVLPKDLCLVCHQR
jgi:predicted CXXCH cytochrome family protein